MMLLAKREEQLVKAFLDFGKLSLKELSDMLQVSSRTVYRSLSDLTESLAKYNIQLLKDGKKYYLSGDLTTLVDLTVAESYSQHERLIDIVYTLLVSEVPVTNEQLQHQLGVSNVTIIQDIVAIEARLLDFDLRIDRQKGYTLIGTTASKRRLLAVLLANYIAISDFWKGQFGAFTILDSEKTKIAQKVFEEYQEGLLDQDAKLKMFLIILLSLAGETTDLVATSNISKVALEFSQKIFQSFAKQTQAFYSMQEIIFYASVLDELVIRRQANPLFMEKFDGEFFYNISNLIDTVSRYTKIDFFKDKVLFRFLFNHIRLSLAVPVLFPSFVLPQMVHVLAEQNHYLHTFIMLIMKDIFPKYIQNDYEYEMVTLHFISSLRRSPDIYPIRILLLSDERRLTRELLVTKIKNVAPFVANVDVKLSTELTEADEQNYDYFLTTKPIAQREIDVIASFPSVKELLDLQDKLQRIQENRTVVARQPSSTAVFRVQQHDLQHYLQGSGQLLQRFRLATLDNTPAFEQMVAELVKIHPDVRDSAYLTRKLLTRFEMSPMAIPNTGLALLHTQSSQVSVSSFSIVTLAQPVMALSMNRQEERISRVLVMLTALDEGEEVRDLMTAISQSIIENHLYTEIYKTGNEQIIYQLLNQIFNEKIKKLES